MTIKSMFFNAVQNGNTYDRVYSAEDFSGYLDKIVGDGVFASPSVNLQVIANNPANMAVYVHAGQGWIQGHKFITTEPIGIIVPAAHGTSARVDSVNFYLDYEEREMGVRIVTGTPGSSEPPSLRQTSTFWEYRLARLDVGAGATSISQANITDRRGTPECPFVAGLIEDIDAESLFAQWDDQFNDWLVGVQEQLSEMGSFVSGIRRLEAVYTTSAASTVSSFNVTTYIPEYSSVTDCLELFINGLNLTSEEYTLSGNTVTLSEAIVQKRVPIDIVVWHVDAAGDNYIASIKLGGLPLTPDANKSVNIPVDDTLSRSRQPADANRTGYELLKKVDKVEGKGLSTNDFSNAYKTKLDGIEDGAEVNVIEEIKLDGVALTPDENRAVDIPVDDTLEEANTPADSKSVGDAIADIEERKANENGYYEGMTVGNALQLVGTQGVIDKDPYIFRKTGYPNDVGNRVYDEIVGGSIVWNQLALSNVQSQTKDGITLTNNGDGSYTLSGTATANTFFSISTSSVPNHVSFVEAVSKSDDVMIWLMGYNGLYKKASIRKPYTASGYALYILKDTVLDNVKVIPQIVDLTAALSPGLADYVYSLEQANDGAGVAWFRQYFKNNYGFTLPGFQHVQTSEKITVGFNQWDGEWEEGEIRSDTGQNYNNSNYWRSKNYIPILPNTEYYSMCPSLTTTGSLRARFYDENKNYIGYNTASGYTSTLYVFKTLPNAHYMRIAPQKSTFPNHDICINISDPEKNGEFEQYKKRSYQLDSSLTLRGVPRLDSANRFYFDGDIYKYDGTGIQKYDIVDLGSLPWGKTSTAFYTIGLSDLIRRPANNADVVLMMCEKPLEPKSLSAVSGNPGTYEAYINITNNLAVLTWYYPMDGYADANAFKEALNGVYLIYEKATPEQFAAEPYQYPMVVDPNGTERFVDYAFEQGERDVEIPVGHTSDYPPNLRDKLQNLPSLSSSGDGRYIIVQTGNQMVLSPDTSAGLIAALEARVAALEGGS